MRPYPLTVVKGGINRLRTKGAPSPDSLYDLLNGRVTDQGTIECRPGTFRRASLSGTKGLVAYRDKLHVFATESVTVPEGYQLHIIGSPNSTPAEPIALSRVHFAAPFMGFLYVVAEFADATIFHFWLSSSGTWSANTAYRLGDVVEPSVPNGLAYQATRNGSAYPSWAANVPRALNDIVEPTVFNNFFYKVVDVVGTTPQSGSTEPDWPTNAGEQVSEDVNGFDAATAVATPSKQTTIPVDTQERYAT